jgi:hypothetical protein
MAFNIVCEISYWTIGAQRRSGTTVLALWTVFTSLTVPFLPRATIGTGSVRATIRTAFSFQICFFTIRTGLALNLTWCIRILSSTAQFTTEFAGFVLV